MWFICEWKFIPKTVKSKFLLETGEGTKFYIFEKNYDTVNCIEHKNDELLEAEKFCGSIICKLKRTNHVLFHLLNGNSSGVTNWKRLFIHSISFFYEWHNTKILFPSPNFKNACVLTETTIGNQVILMSVINPSFEEIFIKKTLEGMIKLFSN